jgi:putative transposase
VVKKYIENQKRVRPLTACTKVFRFRMRPTVTQAVGLVRMAGARRWVWNWALARRKAHYAEHATTLPMKVLSAELTALKKADGTAWLAEADSQALQQTLRDLDRAFANFFEKRSRFPRFKAKKRDDARFRIPQRVKVGGGRVYIPKVGLVRIRQSMPVDLPTKSATFKRNATGHWYVTLTATFEVPDAPVPEPSADTTVGVDLGLKDFAVLSTGERVAAPKFFRRAERALRRAQRTMCRRQKGSNRRNKAKIRVARVHSKIRNQRGDFLHKLTARLVRQFSGICLENLCLKGLVKTKLAKSFLDAAHGEFRRQVEYKAVWNRKQLAVVDRFYPSSRLHAACGELNTGLTLADRTWVCGCGAVLDRDFNAACNVRDEGLRMLAAGYADSQNARGGGVRLSHAAAPPDEPRIPRF